MFRSFSNKASSSNPLSNIWPTTDLHAHLLPGIDDGPQTTEEALILVENLVRLGYKRLVATPHVFMDVYPNTTDLIKRTYEDFQQHLKSHKIPIEFFYAAEYFMDEAFEELVERGDLLTLFGKYVLVEMSTLGIFPKYHEYIFKLKTKGFIPILAHPERYTYFHKDIENYVQLKNAGCLLQTNILSFSGYYGKNIKKCAQQLLEHNLVDFLGTDVHNLQHIKRLEKVFHNQKLTSLIAEYQIKNNSL